MLKTIKRILLVYPPTTRPADFSAKRVRVSAFVPLGLAYIGAVLERDTAIDFKIVDALIEGERTEGTILPNGMIRYGLSDAELERIILEYKPDMVGVSALFSATHYDLNALLSLAKRIDPSIHTIAAGAYAGSNATVLLKANPDIDFIIRGEAEVSFIKLLSKINSGRPDYSKVDGLAYREDGVVRENDKTEFIWDLDSLPMPARHRLNMPLYLSEASPHSTFKRTPYTQLITSRGCPAKCTFCAIEKHWGKRQRVHGAKHVLDEIEILVKEYGVREIHFEDDNLTFDKKRAVEIFDGIIERKLDITWNVPSGMAVYALDESILERMKASGCYSVTLAIESGVQHVVSRLMAKPVNLLKVPALVQSIRRIGMEVKGFFMLGYPGENKADIAQTVTYAKMLELDWTYFFITSPLPGTRLWDICVKEGYIETRDFDPTRSFYESIIRTPEFTPEYLGEVRERAIVDINFKNNPNLVKYDIDRAIDSIGLVVKLYPHFPFANYYLAKSYEKKGDLTRALEYYRKTSDIDKSYESVESDINRLSQIISMREP